MFKIKKRHKPLYKKFIALRTNVQYRRRLLFLKFKKQKWQQLIFYLQRMQNRRKKNFRLYDLNTYHLPKFFNSFKRKHKINLQNKKKISLFYGNLLNKYLIKQTKITLKNKKKNLKQLINKNTFLISLLEQRLDIILYRSHFATSVQNAKQLILHKHIKVNNKLVTNNSYIIKEGDFIKINEKIKPLIYKNICNSHIWPLPPKYLNINYKTFEILISENIKFQNFSKFFPFCPNIYLLIQFYR